MTPAPARRPHLAERVVDAARAAEAAAQAERAPPHAHLLAAPFLAAEPPPAPPPTEPSAAAMPAEMAATRAAEPLARSLLEAAGLVALARGHEQLAEQVALARDQVLRMVDATEADGGRHPRIVVVTSARRGEGKSFTALNLAASIAEGAGRQALLVDAEGGAGSLTDRLGLADEPGLEAFSARTFAGSAPMLPRPTDVQRLAVLPRGRDTAGAAQGTAIAAALVRLAALHPHDVIIVDAAACLTSSTAGLLASVAGQVVMVVQAERTQSAEVEAALDIMDACPNLQLLLNRQRLAVSGSFGERGSGGHAPRHPQA